jgi:exopolysaccharide/PEP-CTERM locus tyrosine autokinase
MNQHSPLRTSGSLLERAAELYGFGLPAAPSAPPASRPDRQAAPAAPAATGAVSPPAGDPAAEPQVEAQPAPRVEPEVARTAEPRKPEMSRPAPVTRAPPPPGGFAKVDREALRDAGFIEPDAPGGALAEEFRIVKRQLLLGSSAKDGPAEEKSRIILVCSAQPDEGKTFCAVNLALSLAAERDDEVLLIDADFPKPEVLSILGLEGGAGLVDALADPLVDPESLVIRTDVRGLSVLPAGRHVPNVTELLASERTREVLARLTRDHPRRIVLFDAPPALMASPASVLATHAGQLLMVVRADKTTESDLREAVGLLSGCDTIRLLLNGAGFAATGRRFGSYYGYGQ